MNFRENPSAAASVYDTFRNSLYAAGYLYLTPEKSGE